MQVTAFAKLLEAKKYGGENRLPGLQLTAPEDGISSIQLLGDDDDVVGLIRRIADLYGYDLSPRDGGPCCCAYGDFYESLGMMAPVHECPSDAPAEDDQLLDREIAKALGIAGWDNA